MSTAWQRVRATLRDQWWVAVQLTLGVVLLVAGLAAGLWSVVGVAGMACIVGGAMLFRVYSGRP